MRQSSIDIVLRRFAEHRDRRRLNLAVAVVDGNRPLARRPSPPA